jgi:steroid 5-alpha reductase family enzyme
MAFVQNWILLGHTLPFFFIISNTASGRLTEQQPLNELDLVVAGLFLVFFLFEAIADEQQWIFQTKKHDWLKNPQSGKYSSEEIADFKRGFLVKGYKIEINTNYFFDLILKNGKKPNQDFTSIQDIPIILVKYFCGGAFICSLFLHSIHC